MNLLLLQGILMLLTFLLTLLCILLPLKIYPRENNLQLSKKTQRIMAFCNCVSGGVFLGVCFIGLLPFCRDKFDSTFQMVSKKTNYPFSELGVVLGFFLILLIEQLVHTWQSRQKPYEEAKELCEHPNKYVFFTSDSEITDDNDSDFDGPSLGIPLSNHHSISGETESSAMLGHTSEASSLEQNNTLPLNGSTFPITKIVNKNKKRKRVPLQKKKHVRGNKHKQGYGHNHSHEGHGHSHGIDLISNNSGLRCCILMVALGIHATFEGIALGLQDEVGKLINLFVGVLVHECLVSFAMGISLARQNLKTSTIVKISILLCSMIPIGNAIGIGIGVIHNFAGSLTSAILQAVAAGTFLYVIFLEILPEEINKPNDRLLKVFFLFLGFGLVACLQVVLGEK